MPSVSRSRIYWALTPSCWAASEILISPSSSIAKTTIAQGFRGKKPRKPRARVYGMRFFLVLVVSAAVLSADLYMLFGRACILHPVLAELHSEFLVSPFFESSIFWLAGVIVVV